MAKRKSNGQFAKAGRSAGRRSAPSGSTRIVRVASKPQIIKVSAPATKSVKRRRSGGGKRSGGILGGLGGRVGSRTALTLGGLALGYASKEKWLEKLPVIGKAGPITSFGLLGWAAEEIAHVKLPAIVHDAITCSLVLSAFNIGFSGGQTLVGDDAVHLPGGAVFFD